MDIELIKKHNEEMIRDLKRFLKDTDYKAIKYAEGELAEEEFAPTRAKRAGWRAEINRLEEWNRNPIVPEAEEMEEPVPFIEGEEQ